MDGGRDPQGRESIAWEIQLSHEAGQDATASKKVMQQLSPSKPTRRFSAATRTVVQQLSVPRLTLPLDLGREIGEGRVQGL